MQILDSLFCSGEREYVKLICIEKHKKRRSLLCRWRITGPAKQLMGSRKIVRRSRRIGGNICCIVPRVRGPRDHLAERTRGPINCLAATARVPMYCLALRRRGQMHRLFARARGPMYCWSESGNIAATLRTVVWNICCIKTMAGDPCHYL